MNFFVCVFHFLKRFATYECCHPCFRYDYVMFLRGVAVLEFDSHPDHNKGPDPYPLH